MPNFTDDLDEFFKTAHFATSVTYTVSGGSPATILVIFEDESANTDQLTQEVYNTRPAVTCRASDVPSITNADTFTINSTTYYVRKVLPDGTGLTKAELSKDN